MTEDLNHDFVEPYHFLGFARVNTMPKTISAEAAAARTRTWPEFYVLPAAAAAALGGQNGQAKVRLCSVPAPKFVQGDPDL